MMIAWSSVLWTLCVVGVAQGNQPGAVQASSPSSSSSSSSSTAAATPASASSSSLHPNSIVKYGIYQLDNKIRAMDNFSESPLDKRDRSGFSENPSSSVSSSHSLPKFKRVKMGPGLPFVVAAHIGGQGFNLSLDTTKNDIWVFNSSVKSCPDSSGKDQDDGKDSSQDISNCAFGGSRFNASKSDSFKELPYTFNSTSIDQASSLGMYASDMLFMGDDLILKNLTFGLVNTSNMAFTSGSFGIGFVGSGGVDDDWNYANFMTSMMREKYINLPIISFSMMGGHGENSRSGEIIFGGLDLEKFIGNLTLIPTNQIQGMGRKYPFIQLEKLSVTNDQGQTEDITSNDFDEPVLVDTNTVVSYLPYDTIVEIASQMNSYYAEDLGLWIQSCKDKKSIRGTIDFNFYGTKISIPISEILLEFSDWNDNPITFSNGDQACILAFADSESRGFSSIGSSILKYMFTVFDLSNFQIGVAQAKNSTRLDIKVISEGIEKEVASAITVKPKSQKIVTINDPTSVGPNGSSTTDGDGGRPRVYVSDGEFYTSGSDYNSVIPSGDDPGPRAAGTTTGGGDSRPSAAANGRHHQLQKLEPIFNFFPASLLLAFMAAIMTLIIV